MGAPSSYTDEIAEIICARLIAGESLRAIGEDASLPNARTVHRWLADESPEFDAFRQQYARAREAQADTIFEEILEIADDATNDYMERKNGDDEASGWAFNGEHVQRSKLRVDARKWMAGKLAPKKYGDKIEHEHKGGVTMVLRDHDETL